MFGEFVFVTNSFGETGNCFEIARSERRDAWEHRKLEKRNLSASHSDLSLPAIQLSAFDGGASPSSMPSFKSQAWLHLVRAGRWQVSHLSLAG